MDKPDLFEKTLKPGGVLRSRRMHFIDAPDDAPSKPEGTARDRSRWTLFRRLNADFLERTFAPLPSHLRLVDLGTGPNQFKPIFSRFEESLRADFNAYQDVDVIADLSKALPFQDASFDIVLSTNFLEHNPDPALSMTESFRILRPGGRCIGIVPFLVGVHQRPYDFYRYTDIQLRRFLEQAGFRDIRIEPIGTSHDTYDQLARQFYQRMIGAAKDPAQRLFWRALWQVQRLLTLAGKRLPAPKIDAPSDRDYTLGYAWDALK